MKIMREFWRCPLCGKRTGFWFHMTRPLCWHGRTKFNGRGCVAMEREWRP